MHNRLLQYWLKRPHRYCHISRPIFPILHNVPGHMWLLDTPLGSRVLWWARLFVCLSVCLSVCPRAYLRNSKWVTLGHRLQLSAYIKRGRQKKASDKHNLTIAVIIAVVHIKQLRLQYKILNSAAKIQHKLKYILCCQTQASKQLISSNHFTV